MDHIYAQSLLFAFLLYRHCGAVARDIELLTRVAIGHRVALERLWLVLVFTLLLKMLLETAFFDLSWDMSLGPFSDPKVSGNIFRS